MQYIKPYVELIDEKDPFKKIELAGRTCYKSEAKITDDSAKKFVCGLIKSKHTAMVEHQVFVFQPDYKNSGELMYFLDAIRAAGYLRITSVRTAAGNWRTLISGNVRALNECSNAGPLLREVQGVYPELVYAPENNLELFPNVKVNLVNLDDISDLTYEEVETHKNFTFRFITDRGVTHELVRHRPCSFAQESTRYVNYKQGISIALPTGFYEKPEAVQEEYTTAFWDSEKHYCNLIEMGESPQQARAVLPTALKTEIVVTTTFAEWLHILNLRMVGTTGAPHPDIKTVMEMAYAHMCEDPIIQKYHY